MFYTDSSGRLLALAKSFFHWGILLILQEVFRYSKPCFSCCSDLVAQNAAPSLLHNMSSKSSSPAPVPLSGFLYWLPGPSLSSSSICQFYLIGFFSPSFLNFRTGGNTDKINSYFPPKKHFLSICHVSSWIPCQFSVRKKCRCTTSPDLQTIPWLIWAF